MVKLSEEERKARRRASGRKSDAKRYAKNKDKPEFKAKTSARDAKLYAKNKDNPEWMARKRASWRKAAIKQRSKPGNKEKARASNAKWQKEHRCSHGKTHGQCREGCGLGACDNFVYSKDPEKKYCNACFYSVHGLPPKNRLVKQHRVNDELVKVFGEGFFSYDKGIQCGCSKRRPDWMRDVFTHVVTVECDEGQHKDRAASCETAKLAGQFLDVAERPLVQIKFNPDSYTKADGTKVKGCFWRDLETGGLRTYQYQLAKRVSTLAACIDAHLARKPEKMITVEKLFFDGES